MRVFEKLTSGAVDILDGILFGFFELNEFDFLEMMVLGKHLLNLSIEFFLIVVPILFNQYR